ncbi:MAG: GUN4 domain-containing protein [Cuspidothrix sp.]
MSIWTPGTSINNGRYIIQQYLGRGGFGIAYSAKDQRKGKIVVIKTLNPTQISPEDFRTEERKFYNEGMRLAKCNPHRHIVEVYEFIEINGISGMVMEFIDGYNLALYTYNNNGLSEIEALRYIDQVGQALEHIHGMGFLHRDVKPNNIILRQNSKEAVLIDFGLAREYVLGAEVNMTNARSKGYAPIEQYQRYGKFGDYTDIYALAATLYNLLTNNEPLPAEFRQTGIALPPPQKFNPKISNKVNAAILKGMELEATKRPQTVREFRQILGLLSKPVVNIPIPSSVNYIGVNTQKRPQENTTVLQTINQDTPFKSSCGMDYHKLCNLLAQGKWKEADEETRQLMLAVMNREKENWLDANSVNNFPCEDLRTIDELWVHYSQGKFGFSVQKRIYQLCAGRLEYQAEAWDKFAEKVGWKKKKLLGMGGDWVSEHDINFDITAPPGHLPVALRGTIGTSGLSSLALKLVSCNL